MSLTEAAVLEALAPVIDPMLRTPLVDLGLIEHIAIEGDEVRVLVGIASPRDSIAAELTRRVGMALVPIAGTGNVQVDVALLTDEQLERLGARLKMLQKPVSGEMAESDVQGRTSDKPIPFADVASNTRVLGISSGKGGVGKSSTTVNLAVALAAMGNEVGIVDADVYGFSVPKMLGIEEDPMVIGELIIPPVAYDVRCMSTGFFVEDENPVMWRGPMLDKALEQFLTDVYWGQLDYLLIDMPPGTGDVALSMAKHLPRSEIYVVTTPQPAAQRVAQRSAQMAKRVNMPLAGVIENMSWFTSDDGKRYELFGSGGGDQLAADLGVDVLAHLPLVPALREGGDTGVPIVVSAPDSEAAIAFKELAERIATSSKRRIYRSELRIS